MSQMGKLMNEALRTFAPAMSEDSSNAIGLQELQDGAMRFASQGGPMIDLFGQVPVLANLSVLPEKEME